MHEMGRRNYYLNYHRYVYAPRNMADAFRETEYASSIFLYKEAAQTQFINAMQWLLMGALMAAVVTLTAHGVWKLAS